MKYNKFNNFVCLYSIEGKFLLNVYYKVLGINNNYV